MPAYSTYSDSQLTELLTASDHAAFTEIHNRYYSLVFLEAYKKLRDQDQAKDIVQELFTNLWIKRENLPVVKNLAGYLITSVRNAIFSYFEHQHVESKYITSLSDFVNTGNIAHTDYRVREKEWEKHIEAAIHSLPKKMREIFELSRKSHLTHKEIAEKLTLSERTVNAQMLNALARLRSKLGSFWLLAIWVFYLQN